VASRPSNTRAVAALTTTASIALLAGACANNPARCEAPSTGTFNLSLSYSQTLPVSVYCAASSGSATQPAACGTPAQTWTGTLTVDGSGARLASGDGGASAWTCAATSPNSSSDDTPDGGAPETACYLLVVCNQQAPSSIGPVQLQILPQASSGDVLALIQDSNGECCVNEYTGTWN
jgi:hypothetical protein